MQVHIFIFIVALTHVGLSIIMIVIASWRVRMWSHWKEDADDYSRA
jgi:Mlo family